MKLQLTHFLAIAVALLLPLSGYAASVTADSDDELEKQPKAQVAKKEKKVIKSFPSLDLAWFLHGLKNNGIALALNYECLVVSHFSIRGTAGAMFSLLPDENEYCLGVTTSLFANWYPMAKTLDKLYLGAGVTVDVLNYFGGENLPSLPIDALVFATPLIGWKQNIANVVVLDFYGGYGFLIFNTHRVSSTDNYIRSGIQLGIRFKLLYLNKVEKK